MIKPEKTKYPGVTFIRVVRPTGGTEKSFYVTYRDRSTGKLKNISVGRQFRDDMTEARAATIRGELIEGKRVPKKEQRREEAARPNIERLWHFYEEANKHKASWRTDRYTVKHFEDLYSRTPQEITTADIDALRKRLESAGKSPQTVRNILELLRRIINYAVKKGLSELPSKLHFEMPKVDNVKTEFLTPDELQKLFMALDADSDQNLASMMRLALATGMRRGALLALQWDDVDFERGFITLRGEEAKNEKTSRIPMNPTARQVLEKITVIAGSPFVFPSPAGGKRTEMRHFTKRIQEKAGLPEGFRPLHGLRHTFASFLASSGKVDLYTLQKLLTHNSPEMTQRYAHLADEAMQRAAGVAAGLFAGGATPKASTAEETALQQDA